MKHRGVWPADWLCEALGVSRGGFYAWLTRPRSQRSRSDEELGAKVRASFLASDRTYGARRVWHDLLAEGVSCGRHRIERLMRLQALKARPRRRRLPPDLGERQADAVAPNVLDRSFEAPAPNRKWIADFTYIWTAQGWLYVAAVVDLFSRRVVGWSMSSNDSTACHGCPGDGDLAPGQVKHRGVWPADWLCEALGVSRGGFYAWLTRPRSQRSRSDEELGAKVRASFLASDRTYGARRVWHDLLAEGVSCGRHRIERLMRLQALKARPRRRRLPPDLGERQADAVAPNVLDRSFEAPAPNRKWIADFTYIWTAQGWLYVAAVVDLFSRRVVGWSMSSNDSTACHGCPGDGDLAPGQAGCAAASL